MRDGAPVTAYPTAISTSNQATAAHRQLNPYVSGEASPPARLRVVGSELTGAIWQQRAVPTDPRPIRQGRVSRPASLPRKLADTWMRVCSGTQQMRRLTRCHAHPAWAARLGGGVVWGWVEWQGPARSGQVARSPPTPSWGEGVPPLHAAPPW